MELRDNLKKHKQRIALIKALMEEYKDDLLDEEEEDEDTFPESGIEIVIDDEEDEEDEEPASKVPYGRILSVQMCLNTREKREFDRVCEEYMEEAQYHIPSKSALLRYLWRYFLKNRDEIDLSEYED